MTPYTWDVDVIQRYYATLHLTLHSTLHSTLQQKPTQQTLNHQPTSLTYGGAQAIDVSGGDMTWVPSKGKAPRG